MPYGLANAPFVFLGFINEVFWDYIHHFVIVYIDSILIYSKNKTDHCHHVVLALGRPRCSWGQGGAKGVEKQGIVVGLEVRGASRWMTDQGRYEGSTEHPGESKAQRLKGLGLRGSR